MLDHGDGRYTVRYTAAISGRYAVAVGLEVRGPIEGSPFLVECGPASGRAAWAEDDAPPSPPGKGALSARRWAPVAPVRSPSLSFSAVAVTDRGRRPPLWEAALAHERRPQSAGPRRGANRNMLRNLEAREAKLRWHG